MYYFKKQDGSVYLKSTSNKAKSGFVSITKAEFDNRKNKPAPSPVAHVAYVPSQKEVIMKQIAHLKSELARTDYEAIKFAEGEMSAQDYEPYKVQRRAWRTQINELEAQL